MDEGIYNEEGEAKDEGVVLKEQEKKVEEEKQEEKQEVKEDDGK